MAEKQKSRELLQPALLDRLTDDEPHKQVESRDQRILSMRAFRQGVLRDLAWLLNTGNHDGEGTFNEYPEIATSVLNYGIRDLCGLIASDLSEGEVERHVREAIRRFEPRILPQSLAVRVKVDQDSFTHNAIAFEITGDLWATPMPERLYLQTKVDLERGDIEFESTLSGGSR